MPVGLAPALVAVLRLVEIRRHPAKAAPRRSPPPRPPAPDTRPLARVILDSHSRPRWLMAFVRRNAAEMSGAVNAGIGEDRRGWRLCHGQPDPQTGYLPASCRRAVPSGAADA